MVSKRHINAQRQDERKAIKDYGRSAQAAPTPHRAAYREIQGDERDHLRKLSRMKKSFYGE